MSHEISRVYFRFYDYTVISLPSSVIYFGGQSFNKNAYDKVAEYKNLEWKLLGNLSRPRMAHSSIKMETTIYTFGGLDYDGDGLISHE